MLLFDIAVGFCLLSAVVALTRFRPGLIAVSRPGYISIASGLSLLAGTASIRIVVDLGIFSHLNFFAGSVIYHLVCAIMLITGTTLLAGGAAQLISVISGRFQAERASSAHLGVIRQVEQLTNVEHRLDQLLMFALEKFVDDCGLAGGEVVKISPRTGVTWAVGAVGTPRPANIAALAPRSESAPQFGFMQIPVIVHHLSVARLDFWGPHDICAGSPIVQSMHVVAGIIARQIKRDELRLRAQFLKEKEQIRHEIEQELSGLVEPQAAITTLATALRSHLGGDFVSVLWFHPQRSQMSRFTAADSGALAEHGLPIPEESSVGGWIAIYGSPVLITDASETTMAVLDTPLASAGLRSVVAVPLSCGNSTTGALILGSAAPQAFRQRHLLVIQDCAPAVARLLHHVELERNAERQLKAIEKRLRRISVPLHEFGTTEYFEDTANLIGREFGWDMVRIAVVDSHDAFLQSLAFAGRDIGTAIVPGDGTLVLAIMSRHARVMTTGISIKLFAEGDKANVSRVELDHVFGRTCHTAEIRPLTFGNRIVGLLSLGRLAANSIDTSPIDSALLSAIEANLALAIASRNTLANPAMSLSISKAVAANRSERDLRNRLRSSLTGILGSLEVIRSETSDLRHDRAKYLEIIDKSARRMQQYLDTPEKVR